MFNYNNTIMDSFELISPTKEHHIRNILTFARIEQTTTQHLISSM